MPLLLPTAVPTPTTSCTVPGLWLEDEIMLSRGVKNLEWYPGNYRAGALRCTAPSCSFRSAGIEGFTSARTAIKKKTIHQMCILGPRQQALYAVYLHKRETSQNARKETASRQHLSWMPSGVIRSTVDSRWTQQSWSAVLEGHW